MNITDLFIDNLYTFSKREFTDEEVLHAKKCLLDYLGVTLAGAKAYYEVEKALLETGIADGGKSTVIGYDKKVSAPIAALINGIVSPKLFIKKVSIKADIVAAKDAMINVLNPAACLLFALSIPRIEAKDIDIITLINTCHKNPISLPPVIKSVMGSIIINK